MIPRKLLIVALLAFSTLPGARAQEIVQDSASLYLDANTAYEGGQWDVAVEDLCTRNKPTRRAGPAFGPAPRFRYEIPKPHAS